MYNHIDSGNKEESTYTSKEREVIISDIQDRVRYNRTKDIKRCE